MKFMSKGIIVEIKYNTIIISIPFIHGGQLCNIQLCRHLLYTYSTVYICIRLPVYLFKGLQILQPIAV